ncbi:MAG: hypothetical protein LKF36_10115 [Lactobacillus sp.]|jgi:hypothetical protein|nr:hypothetical protein [Lactobacillus sp.]
MTYLTCKKAKKGKEIYLKVSRGLHWLCQSVWFKRPQADLVRNRNQSIIANGEKLSIITLAYVCKSSGVKLSKEVKLTNNSVESEERATA